MKLFQIPDEVRSQEYYDTRERSYHQGDEGKCGCCNWKVDTVWLIDDTLEDAIDAFRENYRGLCSGCMCRMISDAGRKITLASEWQ